MWPAFPASDYYGGSAPPRSSALTTSVPAADLAGLRRGRLRVGSHVHHVPVDGLGAQLFPCSLAMGTPQSFPMASGPAVFTPATKSPLGSSPGACTAAWPTSARLEPVDLLRGFHHWFLHTYTFPSR